MTKTWVIVANASEARLLVSNAAGQGLDLLKEFSHPESRAKGTKLASDREGHFQVASGSGGSYAEPTSPKEYEGERFAMELAKELEAGRTANAYERLVLIAPPHFYGLLKGHLNTHLSALVTVHIAKDYTKFSPRDLLEHIQEHVRI